MRDLRPLRFTCPGCNAQPGWSCNAPTETGRKYVDWFHLSRQRRADEAEPETGPATPPHPRRRWSGK